ncbi:MAG: BolA family protein [Gammaproteobacteria bacterium]
MSETAVSALLAARLQTLSPSEIQLQDESRLHRGHREAKNGAHFRLRIVSPQFSGVRLLERHRMVYGALGDLSSLGVHALSVRAFCPDEILRQKSRAPENSP